MEIQKAPEGSKVDYAIYPSLLDAYLRFKRHDDDETFDTLFCKINKIKTEQTEGQLKGVEFEDLVNQRIDGQDLVLSTDKPDHYKSENFEFLCEPIDSIANQLRNCIDKQVYMETLINTPLGVVKLYGIIDYEFPDMIVDLKGTSNYKCNKYKDNTQHAMYSLIRHVNDLPIEAFKYKVSDYVNDFQETYIPSENMFDKLMITIYGFINFINYYKANITDTKIFGGEAANASH